MLQIFPHVVFFATSRGKIFYLAREIIFAILAFLTIPTKLLLKFYYITLESKKKVSLEHNSLMNQFGLNDYPYHNFIAGSLRCLSTSSCFEERLEGLASLPCLFHHAGTCRDSIGHNSCNCWDMQGSPGSVQRCMPC